MKLHIIFKHTQERISGQLPHNVVDCHIKSNRRNYYYLAEIEDTDLTKIEKWYPMPVNDQIARGFPLIDVTQISMDDELESFRDLTVQEEEDKHAAEKALQKIELRSKIHGQVNDMEDIIADLSKRVSLLERVTVRTLHWLYNDSSLSNEIPQPFLDGYNDFLQSYINDVDNGVYKDRIDVEDINEIYNKLRDRSNRITELTEEYLNY